jgi:hypothetical protein
MILLKYSYDSLKFANIIAPSAEILYDADTSDEILMVLRSSERQSTLVGDTGEEASLWHGVSLFVVWPSGQC